MSEVQTPSQEIQEAALQAAEPTPAPESESASPAVPQQETESFAELFAAQEAPGSHLSPGQRVKATIVAITNDTVFVSTGSKVDGIVERSELEENGELPCAVGDQLDLYVITVSPQEVRLSKMMSGAGGLMALEDARDAALPVEGKVKALVKGGFAVEIMKRRAFCPLGQIDLRPADNPESFIGQTLPFLITKLEKSGHNIVVSRRILLEQAQAESRDAFLATVSDGSVLEGTVSRLAPFGAFVELAPGVEGLIHVSELSWSRVGQPDEAVSTGDRLRVKILSIAPSDKGVRISLSARQVTEDPWKDINGRLTEGEVVSGKVVRNAAFGSFVEVLPGIEGLIHLSELSYDRQVRKPDDIVTVGETVSVRIKGLELDKKRLSLSLRDAAGDPWQDVTETLAVGNEVTGTVENRSTFGLFIALLPGVTGLLPSSSLAAARNKMGLDKAQSGDAVQVVIRALDTKNRKVTLGVPGAADTAGPSASEERDWKKHAPKAAPASFGGSLGSLMQAALQKKK